MIEEQIKATGNVLVEIVGPDGQVKDRREIKNLVVNVGKAFIAGRMVGTPTAMSHMAIGASSTAAANGDTALGAELGRVALASSAAAGAVVTYTASFPAGTGTGAVVEAGVFNAACRNHALPHHVRRGEQGRRRRNEHHLGHHRFLILGVVPNGHSDSSLDQRRTAH